MSIPAIYLTYLVISIGMTAWVGRTLHRRGRIFLVDGFHGNEPLADSVNDLLIVGFYLLNAGYVLLALKYGQKSTELGGAIEFLATKLGLVMLVLGGIHMLNLYGMSKCRQHNVGRQVAGTGESSGIR